MGLFAHILHGNSRSSHSSAKLHCPRSGAEGPAEVTLWQTSRPHSFVVVHFGLPLVSSRERSGSFVELKVSVSIAHYHCSSPSVCVLSVAHCFHKPPEAIKGRILAPDMVGSCNDISPIQKSGSYILLSTGVDERLIFHLDVAIGIHIHHRGWSTPA